MAKQHERRGRTLAQAVHAAVVIARNAVTGGSLQALALATEPRRMAGYIAESRFLFRTYADRRGLPQRPVHEVLGGGGEQDIRLGNLEGETWFGPTASYLTDIVSLCMICRILRPARVFEIGTLHGYTALHFALNSPDDAIIFTLDLPRGGGAQPSLPTTIMDAMHVDASLAAQRRCFEGLPVESRIRPLYGDSATFDFSPYHDSIDLFFIDGAHSYDYVRSDTERALKCVRPGGVIAWHDFGRAGVNGVSRWLLEMQRDGRAIYSVPGGSLAFMVAPD
ncbi:MAG TPA: class I SAM-dependent methyltransferase [Longimicrobiales bacterium]|nr:class I SAM-dependent methyltransferase [Longimicrobiales bacterium]